MNILIISHLYPSVAIKSGYFVYNQIEELSKHLNVYVVIPKEMPTTYRNIFKINGIRREIENLLKIKKEPPPNSYKIGEVMPFFKMPSKQFCFCQSKLFLLQNKKDILRIVNHFQPKIIYAHQIFPGGGIAYYIKKDHGIPYIVYEHGVDVLDNNTGRGFALRNNLNFRFARKVLENASCVLTNSQRMQNEISKHFNNIKVSISHIGVDVKRYGEFKERRRIKKDRFNMVSLCYFTEEKGIRDNIMAVIKLVKKGYNISYDIYGKGEYETILKRLVDQNRLGERIKFKGFLPNEEVIDTLNKYDVFVMPSWEEAFGVVYLEALAAGIPAIGTQNEGPDEINRYGDIVYTVPRNNVEALAGTIEGLIEDYNSSKERVMLGQKVIMEEFNWSKIIDSLLKTIDSIN